MTGRTAADRDSPRPDPDAKLAATANDGSGQVAGTDNGVAGPIAGDGVHPSVGAERRRIARDLHDGVVQPLFALSLELADMAGNSAAAEVAARLTAAVEQIDTVIGELRHTIFDLKPVTMSGPALTDALHRLAGEMHRRDGLVAEVYVDPAAADTLTPTAAELVLFVREALSNVAHHSQARSCQLSLRNKNGVVIVKVSDDGRGFASRRAGGDGLDNLAVRAAALGGRLEIDSRPGRGSTLRLLIPTADRPPSEP